MDRWTEVCGHYWKCSGGSTRASGPLASRSGALGQGPGGSCQRQCHAAHAWSFAKGRCEFSAPKGGGAVVHLLFRRTSLHAVPLLTALTQVHLPVAFSFLFRRLDDGMCHLPPSMDV
jgi:hypothetical protein